jgi:hypothetical protein
MINKRYLLNSFFIFFILGVFYFQAVNAAQPLPSTKQFEYKLLEAFPGFFDKGQVMTDFPGMILAIYKFGIWTVGIAGFFMLVVGGFMYMASAGNTSSAGSAKGIVIDALIGIAAALGAYLFLYVINPDLTKMNISFTTVDVTETEGTGGSTAGSTKGACVGAICASCKPGTICAECKSCGIFSNDYSALCYNGGKVGNSGCKLNSTLAAKLNAANLSSVGAQVSEAWPPTVYHSAKCHQDGTCADVRCKAQCDNVSMQDLKKIYDTLKNAGLNPVFEKKGNCSTYTAYGIGCISPLTMTSASSFHVNLP